MNELQSRLHRLTLRLDHMGLRVEQAVADALAAVDSGDLDAGLAVDAADSVIDREEVEIEQECIRLLALYQPTAIDLRMICTVIKINNDLERIADLACSIGRRVKHVVNDKVPLAENVGYQRLCQDILDVLGTTVRILSTTDPVTARGVIKSDNRVDEDYWLFVRSVLDGENTGIGGVEPAITMINLAKALERIGDHCTNIAEDIIFLRTGEVVRHASAFEDAQE